MADDWKLQVSYKTQSGDLINVRANTVDELSVLLEGIGDFSTQIAAVKQLVVGAGVAAPLSMPSTIPNTTQPPSSQAPQAQAPSGMGAPATGTGPTCQHGARKYKSGISAKTGNPYAMWTCPLPQGPEQCRPVN
jgi:hypothetical protein